MSYDAKDIKSLTFREGVRTRIQMYLGSADNDGTYQALKEIINNATDEALVGYGNRIEVVVSEKDNTISVRDYGRGVPFLVKDDGSNVLVDIYTKAHTGGKFDDSVYKNVGGLNGCGGSCVCLSSKEFQVTSYRDGRMACASFLQGKLQNYWEDNTSLPNGTLVIFSPDPEVFKDEKIGYSYDRICKELHDISYLYIGVTFSVTNQDTGAKKEYCAKNGIIDFVKEKNAKPLHNHIIYETCTDGTDRVEIAFQWGGGREDGYVFVNGLRCPEGGSPITGAKTAITRTFNSQAGGQNFDGDSIRNGMVYVINCSVAQPSFANQTKSKINNTSLRGLASTAFSNGIKNMKLKYKDEFDTIVELLKKVARAEAAAEKARQKVLGAVKEIENNQKKKVFASDKLKDAEFLGQDSTLLIVEGNSAMGGMSQARDYTKYGILAIRGKIINCLSNDEEKIFQNEEIKLLLSAMNITPGKYNASKLRYGKLAICTDADSDGYHIGLLIMAALTYLAPNFIKEGRLCWLRSPLYIVNNRGKESYYFTDEEFSRDRAKIKGEVTRAKGLGELPAETAHASMFTKEYQRIDVMEYTPEAIDLLLNLMGDDVEQRRNFIMNNIDFSTIKE